MSVRAGGAPAVAVVGHDLVQHVPQRLGHEVPEARQRVRPVEPAAQLDDRLRAPEDAVARDEGDLALHVLLPCTQHTPRVRARPRCSAAAAGGPAAHQS